MSCCPKDISKLIFFWEDGHAMGRTIIAQCCLRPTRFIEPGGNRVAGTNTNFEVQAKPKQ